MKKILKNIEKSTILVLVVVVLLGISSCEKKLEDEFYNPDKQTKPSFEMLFTGVLQSTELFRLEYGPGYHQIRAFNRLLGLGVFPDANNWNGVGDNTVSLWQGWSGVNLRNIQFEHAYSFNKNIPIINLMLNGLPEAEKKDYEIYVSCINVVKAYIFQRLTDIYDDVPYFEANGAYQEKFFAKYDTQKAIYYALLDELKTIDTKLDGYVLNQSLAHEKFKSSDILNDGNVLKWRKFANSLRLRMALRLSIIDPAKSKEVFSDVLDNNKPYVSESEDLIGMAEKDYAHVMELLWPRAFFEMYYNCTAPRYMVREIFGYKGPATPNEDVDPRLKVILQPNTKGDYIGLDVWGPDQITNANIDMDQFGYSSSYKESSINWDYDDNIDPHYSMYNKMTFLNFKMKYPAFSPTESHLILAEVAVRFPEYAAKVNADVEFRKAIQLSIDWYYDLNNTNTFSITSMPSIPKEIMPGSVVPKPSDSDIDAFLTKKVANFSSMNQLDKYKAIFFQKYIHLNDLNLFEIWAEQRRLQKELGIIVPKSKIFTWMERFYYPASEEQTNAENFTAVAGKNDYNTPVWWTGRTK